MHSGHAHAVETVAAPFEVGFHACGMVFLVVGAIVGFLETDDAIETGMSETGVVLG